MKTRKYVLFLLSVFLTMILFAQSGTSVSGRVMDHNEGIPLGYATVSVMTQKDSAVIAGAITDDDGRFVVDNLANGDYQIRISYMGYVPSVRNVLVGGLNKTIDLGDVKLDTESVSISDVTVIGKKQTQNSALSMQRFSVEDNILASGGSVMDMLRNLPGINVDQEGKINLRGSDKVLVLIDGRVSGITGYGSQKNLENIALASIESIEVINNPSAKYDAAGMAGVINIKYKKETRKGLNGEVGFSTGVGALSRKKADLPTGLPSYRNNMKYIPSLSLNYKNEKINWLLQGNVIQQYRLPNNEFTTRYYKDATVVSQVAENRKQTHYNFKTGLDWVLNEKNDLVFMAMFDYETHRDTSRIGFFNQETMVSNRNWSFSEPEITGYVNAAVFHKYKFDQPGHTLNTSFQYTRGWEDETYNLYEDSPGRVGQDQTHVIAPENTFEVATDYARPFAIGRLEAGAKFRHRYMPITYDVIKTKGSPIYDGLGDWSDWKEALGSVYANLIIEKRKFDLEAGLRMEYTNVNYDISPDNIYYKPSSDKYNYFDLFPNVRFTFKPNEQDRISVFYNRRIDRPSEAELRIFPKYDDPELLKVGNPYLRPQYTQNFGLAYKHLWKTGSVYVAGYYRMISSHFTRIYAEDKTSENMIINKVYQNIGDASNLGVELLVDQQVLSCWNVSGSFNWYRNKIDRFTGELLFPYKRPFEIKERIDNPWYVKLNNQISLPAQFRVQLSGAYYAAKNIAQGRELDRWSVDFGVQKLLMKNRLELSLTASDLFNTMGIRQEITGDGFTALYENYLETQVITLGAKYKF